MLKASQIQGEGFDCFLVSKQNLKPFSYLAQLSNTLTIIKNRLEMRKLVMASKIKRDQEFKKNKPLNITNASFQTPKRFHVCCYFLLEFKDDL